MFNRQSIPYLIVFSFIGIFVLISLSLAWAAQNMVLDDNYRFTGSVGFEAIISATNGIAIGNDGSSFVDGGDDLISSTDKLQTATHTVQNKGSRFGVNGGVLTAIPRSDCNIFLYNAGETNWAGLGADGSGNVWFKTGTSGNPNARFLIYANGNIGIATTSITTTGLEVNGAVFANGGFSSPSGSWAKTIVAEATEETLEQRLPDKIQLYYDKLPIEYRDEKTVADFEEKIIINEITKIVDDEIVEATEEIIISPVTQLFEYNIARNKILKHKNYNTLRVGPVIDITGLPEDMLIWSEDGNQPRLDHGKSIGKLYAVCVGLQKENDALKQRIIDIEARLQKAGL